MHVLWSFKSYVFNWQLHHTVTYDLVVDKILESRVILIILWLWEKLHYRTIRPRQLISINISKVLVSLFWLYSNEITLHLMISIRVLIILIVTSFVLLASFFRESKANSELMIQYIVYVSYIDTLHIIFGRFY